MPAKSLAFKSPNRTRENVRHHIDPTQESVSGWPSLATLPLTCGRPGTAAPTRTPEGGGMGEGGMGEAWRARDSKLGREVSIKTLPVEFDRDEQRLARFEREPKLLASLNHTNIAVWPEVSPAFPTMS